MNSEGIFTYEEFLKEIIAEDNKKQIDYYSPLKWYGGKFYIVDEILKYMPKHYCYVEPFFGSGQVFFKKPKAMVEVINDIDLNIYSFFKVLANESLFNEFIKKVYLLYAHRKIFEEQKQVMKEDSIIDKAVVFFYRVHLGFNAKVYCNSYATGTERNKAMSLNAAKRRLFFAHERLRDVFVECKDWKEIVKQYDSANTFIYLDPPYIQDTRKTFNDYKYELSNEQHQELVDILLSLKSKVMLSGYANPIYEKLEQQGWTRIDIDTYCWTINSKYKNGVKDKRIESLWINYQLPKQKLF